MLRLDEVNMSGTGRILGLRDPTNKGTILNFSPVGLNRSGDNHYFLPGLSHNFITALNKNTNFGIVLMLT